MGALHFLAFLALLVDPAAAGGSWRDVADVTPSSKVHRLTTFALDTLKRTCASSNSYGCSKMGGEASLLQVREARSQVVSGMNYDIEAQTSIGHLHLKIYEQSWTSTLKLTEATLSLPPVGASLAMAQVNLIEAEMALDAAAFAAAEARVAAEAAATAAAAEAKTPPPSPTCTGGKVWHQCGSACEPTCKEPSPMCIRMCVAKCECPSDKPLWEANQCIARSSCPLPGAVEEPRAREAEPIHMMGGKMEPPMMGGMMGGWSAATDIGPASKVHRLAAFSFAKLQTHCAASNALVCNGGFSSESFHHVASARTQVVAGTNYMIEAVTSAGTLSLRIFEQPWSSTLELSRASLEKGSLLTTEEKLALDVNAFAAFSPNGPILSGATAPPAILSGVTAPESILSGATAPEAKPKPKPGPLPMRHSAIMVGGALGLGGGHYTGSDQELFAQIKASPPPAASPAVSTIKLEVEEIITDDAQTQWWLFTFFVLGVGLVAALGALARKRMPDEQPINNAPTSSSTSADVHAKHDSSMA